MWYDQSSTEIGIFRTFHVHKKIQHTAFVLFYSLLSAYSGQLLYA